MKRTLFLALTLLAGFALAQQARYPDLQKAQTLLAQKKYDAALKALDAAEKKGGLDREALLTLLESRGLALASLNKLDDAEKNFRSVLALDGRRDLSGKYQGKVNTVIAAAKDWYAKNGGIELGALEPGAENGRVKQISLFVKNDPLKLITHIRFYVRADGGAWKPLDTTVANDAAAVDVDASTIEWWAAALTEKQDQLMFLASAGRPVKQTAPAAAPVAVAKNDAPKEAVLTPEPKVTPVEDVRETTTTAMSPVRGVGIGFLVAGAVAAGVGTYFGISANTAATNIRASLMNGGYDPNALYQQDQARITQSTIANALLIGAGALGVTGLILIIVGKDVVVSPNANGGATVSGRF
ncbi:MAG: hypothetical protein DI536_30915 [Archangium gephyra]|uniref:Tetratricopeptide repeat protein n=1 Tax=Archangium gephyra TaxID=48 RepID=A0A2W5SRY7_9BACT|nr:MAG: hypothetical protein DI536_30915 [Archangium gephyra]